MTTLSLTIGKNDCEVKIVMVEYVHVQGVIGVSKLYFGVTS